MLNIGDMLDNRYQILSRIGQGGMSYVYRAADTTLGREVAVKVLKEEFAEDAEFVERFKNEARSAAKLSHPNIVAVYDIVDSGELHYIVMELVEGITLKNYIAKKGVLTNKETIGIALQAAEGIAEAHRNGIIHRDIKPQNIIISKDGKIKVADFGIAKAVSGDTLNSQSVIGSAHYIAPEQAKSKQADLRSDLYSLGISMYEMITGRVPYDGDNTVNIVLAHIQNAMVPPSVYNHDIYPALNDIILKATKKDPEERYQSAEELIDDLRQAVNEPEGHFVRLYDTVSSGEKAEESVVSGDNDAAFDAALAEGTTDNDAELGMSSDMNDAESGLNDSPNTDSNNTASDNDTDAAGHTGLTPAEKKAAEAKKKIVMFGGFFAVIFIIGVTALFMIKRSGDRNAQLAESLLDAQTTEQSDEESESEMDYTISIKGEDLMPDLIGMNVDEARAILSNQQMSMDSSSEEFSDTYENGLIIKQSPSSGDILPAGTTVYVTVSKGSVFDDLQNHTAEEAGDMLAKAGYKVDNTVGYDFSDVVAEGLVCSYKLLDVHGMEIDDTALRSGYYRDSNRGTSSETLSSDDEAETETTAAYKKSVSSKSHNKNAAEIRKKAASVMLIISKGKREDYILMPVLTGLTKTEAVKELEENGLSVGTVTALNTDDYLEGQTAEQSVAAGDYVKKGSSVDIKISVGNSGEVADGTELSISTSNKGSGSNNRETTSNELNDEYYYGSIDTLCTIGKPMGPGGSDHVRVGVRLRQRVDGADEYTQISAPIPVAPGTRIPITFKNIRGAYGVDNGYVEVFNADSGELYSSYSVSFKSVYD